MASTGVPGIQCAHCGWLNDPGARMCGGCGRPLVSSVTNAPMKGGVPADEAITDPELRTVAAPRGRATPIALPSIPTGRGMSPVARVFLVLGVVILLLACVCAGAWGLVIRPALHNQVDGAIRTQMDNLADQANAALIEAIPTIQAKGGTFAGSVPASTLNQQIAASASAQSPVSNTQVSFADGQLKITFDSNNQQNSITTTLGTTSGHLVARGTTVTGLIALVESGPELESSINDALSRLPPNAQSANPQFSSVTLADDVLSYTITVK
jgi:type II secretory pathway component PulM